MSFKPLLLSMRAVHQLLHRDDDAVLQMRAHLQCHRPAAGLKRVLIRPWNPPDLMRNMEPGDCRRVTLRLLVVRADDGCDVQLLMARPASHKRARGHA